MGGGGTSFPGMSILPNLSADCADTVGTIACSHRMVGGDSLYSPSAKAV